MLVLLVLIEKKAAAMTTRNLGIDYCCDICGKIAHVVEDSYKPEGWSRLIIAIEHGIHRDHPGIADICNECIGNKPMVRKSLFKHWMNLLRYGNGE
jgi:hypothetical protein